MKGAYGGCITTSLRGSDCRRGSGDEGSCGLDRGHSRLGVSRNKKVTRHATECEGDLRGLA